MSTRSSFKERFERLAAVRDAGRGPSATADAGPVDLVLRATGDLARRIDLARLLVAHGLSPRRAHRVVDRLAETLLQPPATREGITLFLPGPVQRERLAQALRALGVDVTWREAGGEIAVKAIRDALGLTQEEFALRFGLDLATLRNWEQGRTRPDGPARVLLRVIARDPKAVESALS